VAGVTAAVAAGLWAAVSGAVPLPISAVQGGGDASPYLGQSVTVRGVVTALTDQGFFLQTPDGERDGDDATSEGIFVYTGAAPAFLVADAVELTARVQEYNGLTELTGPGGVSVLASGVPLPAPVAFDAALPSPHQPWPAAALERFEGMLVEVADGFVTGPADDEGSFLVVAGGYRAMREPGIAWPGLEGLPVWDGNPEVLTVYTAHSLAREDVWAGARVSVSGGLSEYRGLYELVPAQLTVTRQASVPALAASVPGELRLATWNLRRLFDDQDAPGVDDTVLQPATYELRLAKAASFVTEVLARPDVLVVQEVENAGVLARLGELAADPAWGAPYRPVLLDGDDPSGLDVGVLLAPGIAAGEPVQLGRGESFSYGGASYRIFDRPPLVLQVEMPAPAGAWPFTVVAVHLRSLLGVEDDDFARTKRQAGARWLAEWLAPVLDADPTARLAVVGDFNAFQFSDGFVDVLGEIAGAPDPAGALYPAEDRFDPDLVNPIVGLPPDERYTYVLNGNGEALDHALLSRGLASHLAAVAVGRGCADAPEVATAREGAAGASDHDALVVTLRARAARARGRASGR